VSFEGVVIPQTAGEYPGRVTFETDEETYLWLLPDDIAFEKGKIYVFELSIKGQAIVAVKSSIVPWNETDLIISVPEDHEETDPDDQAAMNNVVSSINQKQ
jgi:hypothetical protein